MWAELTRGYLMLEHTSDAYIEAYGKDFKEAFEEAGKALFAVIIRNIEHVKKDIKKVIEADGIDKFSLLYNWLEKLLILFDVEGIIVSEINVKDLSIDSEPIYIKAEVFGERYDPARHKAGIDVKSPTYWLMEFGEKDDIAYVRFVLDI
ncbi:MAG: archease [Nitrososphaerota archaeon]